MNPRQRRGVLLLIVASLGALALILALASYISNVEEQLGPMATQLRLTEDIAYLEEIPAEAVEVVEVPKLWLSEESIGSTDALAGRVAATNLTAGTALQVSSLTDEPTITVGEREVAILVDAETGVGGKIQPGDIVDVYATYGQTELIDGETATRTPPRAEVVLEQVRIVAVSEALQNPGQGGENIDSGQAVPVTFALSGSQVLRLAYAESFASEVRLGLRLRNDDTPLTPGDRLYSEG